LNANPWPPGTATGIGSMPGTDPREAAKIVLGELPDLPHLPELPARGLGADMIGRTAALLVDLAIEEVTSGYRVTSRPGRDHNRAVALLRTDLDAFDEAAEQAAARPQVVKVQICGPWTLAANVELRNGHRVLTDAGAVREFTASLAEGVAQHAAEVARRTGARVVVQLDEPSLPAVLAGSLPTPSGLGAVAAVSEADAQAGLRTVLEAAQAPRILHCCAANPPIALLRAAGSDIVAVDVAQAKGAEAIDAIGEAWDQGASLCLGVVPSTDPPATPPTLRQIGKPVFDLADQLGFDRDGLADRVVPTPACGLAGATPAWARRALSLVRDVGRAMVEPPEGW
jgi:methionine synthase II (cobalamin-independent)